MRTAPTVAIEVLLGLPPLHLQLEAEARAGIYRLYCSDKWKPKSKGFGHAYMTQGVKKEHILQMGTDKMILRHVYGKPFMVRFPDKSKWKDGFQPNKRLFLFHYTGFQLLFYNTKNIQGSGCFVHKMAKIQGVK
jgi:hypothetical protein